MKTRPISSKIRRKCFFEDATPRYSAKKDFSLLHSPSKTARFLDSNFSKLSQLSNINPLEILSKEVANQLKTLKKHTNSTHIYNSTMKTRLKNFSLDLSNTIAAKQVAQSTDFRLKTRSLSLKALIVQVQSRQNILLQDQDSYLYMKQRLESMQIFLDIKKNELALELNYKNSLVFQVQALKSTSLERKTLNIRVHKDLNRSLTFFNREYKKVNEKINNDLELMEFIDDNRDMRTYRQQNIIEQVGINEKNRKEKNIRESLLLHKAWFLQLKKKHEKSMIRFSRIDLAFKTIKSITGLDDINELTKKLLTKEENLQNLTEVISRNKDKIDNFSRMNQELQKNIAEITVSDAACLKGNDIKKISARLMLITNQKIYLNQKFLRISTVLMKVREWIVKMITGFDQDFRENGEKVFELFSILKFKIHSNIRPKAEIVNENFNRLPVHNPVSLRNKERFSMNFDLVTLAELNHFESSTSNSKSLISLLSEKKIRKK